MFRVHLAFYNFSVSNHMTLFLQNSSYKNVLGNSYCMHTFISSWRLPHLNQRYVERQISINCYMYGWTGFRTHDPSIRIHYRVPYADRYYPFEPVHELITLNDICERLVVKAQSSLCKYSVSPEHSLLVRGPLKLYSGPTHVY